MAFLDLTPRSLAERTPLLKEHDVSKFGVEKSSMESGDTEENWCWGQGGTSGP
jgi:hypothetical protein